MGCGGIVLDFSFDLSLLRQGLSIDREFGLASLEELARTGEFLEHAFYEKGSLRFTPDGVTFILRNAPLRMGAFSQVRVHFDDAEIPANRASVVPGDSGEPRLLSQLDRDHPLILPPGRPTRFRLCLDRPATGRHTIRLEFQSVAIPPVVWIEICDSISSGDGA